MIEGFKSSGRAALVALMCLTIGTVAQARTVHPKNGSPKKPPFPLMAIAEDIRAVSGDASYAVVPDDEPEKEEKKEEKKDEKKADDKPKPKPPDDAKKADKDPFAPQDIGPDDDSDFDDDSFDDRMNGKDPKRSMAEDHARNKARQTAEHERKKREWQEEFEADKKRWAKEHEAFLERVPAYKKALATISAPPPKAAFKTTKMPAFAAGSKIDDAVYKLVDGALDVPIRDQAQRPTCASFAGIRAVEIVLQQNGIASDLSEQYFYWASKPDCRDKPCDQPGSWSAFGYQESMRAPMIDIPAEASCPYSPQPIPGNETALPLAPRCQGNGVAKVTGVAVVNELPDIIAALNQDVPVVVGTRLSENFFQTSGLVDAKRADTQKTRDSMHAQGHAYLIVGYMKLPASLHATEGKLCLVAANSWSPGWGKGGYACISEKWFETYKIVLPYLGVVDVDVP